MSFLSGFISIIGTPNVGKSTLLNGLLGQKIAITSPKPQTTRNRILGIYNGYDCQMVFIDTPGIHQTRSLLHKSMVGSAKTSLGEVDIILLVVEPDEPANNNELNIILRLLRKTDKTTILTINKIDLVKKENLLPIIDSYSKIHHFDSIIPVSALYGDGLETLRGELRERLSPGPQFFPPDMVTDKSEEFLITEIVREKIYYETRDELPYSCAVMVEKIEEDPERNLLAVMATIFVEKASQKGIIIGKNGRMIKKIGRNARMEMERIFSSHVYLELFVKIEKNWSSDTRSLRRLGY
ncbi:MAG: GTPase Era [Deltaproteobacteria bacterium]|jgi:GTP-binding protein Era|nr:MAG: GTPase Era [Deltaproteobacteria bacterium]